MIEPFARLDICKGHKHLNRVPSIDVHKGGFCYTGSYKVTSREARVHGRALDTNDHKVESLHMESHKPEYFRSLVAHGYRCDDLDGGNSKHVDQGRSCHEKRTHQ